MAFRKCHKSEIVRTNEYVVRCSHYRRAIPGDGSNNKNSQIEWATGVSVVSHCAADATIKSSKRSDSANYSKRIYEITKNKTIGHLLTRADDSENVYKRFIIDTRYVPTSYLEIRTQKRINPDSESFSSFINMYCRKKKQTLLPRKHHRDSIERVFVR